MITNLTQKWKEKRQEDLFLSEALCDILKPKDCKEVRFSKWDSFVSLLYSLKKNFRNIGKQSQNKNTCPFKKNYHPGYTVFSDEERLIKYKTKWEITRRKNLSGIFEKDPSYIMNYSFPKKWSIEKCIEELIKYEAQFIIYLPNDPSI